MSLKMNWDSMGIATSLLCALHCLFLPLILGSLPLFGVDIIHNIFFEWLMISLAFCIGVYALIHGYKTHHRSPLPILIFATGFLFLITKQFFPAYEPFFLIPAVILIISAHWLNYRMCRRSKCSSPLHRHG